MPFSSRNQTVESSSFNSRLIIYNVIENSILKSNYQKSFLMYYKLRTQCFCLFLLRLLLFFSRTVLPERWLFINFSGNLKTRPDLLIMKSSSEGNWDTNTILSWNLNFPKKDKSPLTLIRYLRVIFIYLNIKYPLPAERVTYQTSKRKGYNCTSLWT